MTAVLWTSDELVKATRGTLHGPAFEITDLVIDSRKSVPGCLFVALPGERVDGHDFVGAALNAGAAAALQADFRTHRAVTCHSCWSMT